MCVFTRLFHLARRWAYCQFCQTQTDQDEVTSRNGKWKCESCHHLLNFRGEVIGSD